MELVCTGRWLRRNDRTICARVFDEDERFVVEFNIGPAKLDDAISTPWAFRLPGSHRTLELAKQAAQVAVLDRFNVGPNVVPIWTPEPQAGDKGARPWPSVAPDSDSPFG